MIVGTAGHIDHGKTALVKALTGVDADRLAEEQRRGITIDLGFAYLPLADGSVLGFVDVPGHERFMRNMLAGASGIDFALLVVAADDGIKPQTREHLAAIELLGVRRGLVALTKCDLVPPERIAEMAGQIATLIAGGTLRDAAILPVSARTGSGIAALREVLAAESARPAVGGTEHAFRLAVDRSFSLKGTGTVVTGTVLGGAIEVGAHLLLSPSGQEVRIRSLHAQNQPAERADAGMRCGVNLAGVAAEAIQRGEVLLDPALHAPTARIDAMLHLLPAEARPLGHWTPVRLHHGTAEVGARVVLLGDEKLVPGSAARVQLVLERPIAAAARDHFVLRDTSATRSIGGGHFIDLRAPARRSRTPERLAQLEAMDRGDPAAALAAQLASAPHWVDWTAFIRDRALSGSAAGAVLCATRHRALPAKGGTYLVDPDHYARLGAEVRQVLEQFHQRHPQLLGMSAQRIVAALDPRPPRELGPAVLQELLRTGQLAGNVAMMRLPDHQLGLDRPDQLLWDLARPHLTGEARFQPLRLAQLAEATGRREFDLRRVLKAKAQQGALVEVAPGLFILREAMAEVTTHVAELAELAEDGLFPAAALRDRLGGGRKAAIQMLEHFDRLGITLRRADLRLIDPRRLAAYREQIGRDASPVGRPDFKSG